MDANDFRDRSTNKTDVHLCVFRGRNYGQRCCNSVRQFLVSDVGSKAAINDFHDEFATKYLIYHLAGSIKLGMVIYKISNHEPRLIYHADVLTRCVSSSAGARRKRMTMIDIVYKSI